MDPSTNYICDNDVAPKFVQFANGRTVRIIGCEKSGYYLEIGMVDDKPENKSLGVTLDHLRQLENKPEVKVDLERYSGFKKITQSDLDMRVR